MGRPTLEQVREKARKVPRGWSPPDWLRRVLTLSELEAIDEALPTCWVRVFSWWHNGSTGWNMTEDCVRGVERCGACYCGKYRDLDEARQAASRWSKDGKLDWQHPQVEAIERTTTD